MYSINLGHSRATTEVKKNSAIVHELTHRSVLMIVQCAIVSFDHSLHFVFAIYA